MGGNQTLFTLWKKIDVRGPDECWPWIAKGRKPDGRATIRWGGKGMNSSRVIWSAYNGIIPPPHLHVCHSCNNPPCCNPSHLYLATHRENIVYAVRCGRVKPPRVRGPRVKKPHSQLSQFCVNGHERTPENTYIRPKDNVRVCKKCRASYGRKYRLAIGMTETSRERAAQLAQSTFEERYAAED